MDEDEALNSMWEFPATWKLLQLLSRPLSFSAPTPTVLENALLKPSDHLALLANCHGRLLGLSVGKSSAKKWLPTVSRFVRNRQDDFTFLAEDFLLADVPPVDDVLGVVKKEPVEGQIIMKQEPITSKTSAVPNRLFPVEEQGYFRLRSSSRLLVLHTIAEIVLSHHDSLLSAGSLADLEVHELRYFPVASDAVGNDYWYFNDLERVYREPTRLQLKTRRQKADEEAKAVKDAAKEAAEVAARLVREEKRKEVQRKQEEIKRKKEERKRKSIEKWGPRVAASRTTRASRKAATSLLDSTEDPISQDMSDQKDEDESMDIVIPRTVNSRQLGVESVDNDSAGLDQIESIDGLERRTSGRRRKPPRDFETTPVSARKRPRKTDTFADASLRKCEGWEIMSIGGDSLGQILERFHLKDGTVRSTEKALVRRLTEDVLPAIMESEEIARKELERLERKKKTEVLLASFSKRSSRVQALAQKREEQLKKIAEEEERERQHLRRIAEHEEVIRSQVSVLEKEQSIEIRNTRQAHGRTQAIERDELLQRTLERQGRRKESRVEDVPVRRSTRTQRSSKRLMEMDAEIPKGSHSEGDATSVQTEGNALSVVDNRVESTTKDGSNFEEKEEAKDSIANEIQTSGDGSGAVIFDEGQNDLRGSDNQSQESSVVKDVTESKGALSSLADDADVSKSHTWMKNQEDGLPIRVLDRFFFASQDRFADAPLETFDSGPSHITGLGIAIPPARSASDAIRVKIGRVEEWVIEYGESPKMWVRSENAWYELRDPALEFRDAFTSTQKKFEICVRISILGSEMRSAQLTFESIVHWLSFPYENMMPYTEEGILAEKQFIVAQMEALNRRSILRSQFMQELYKHIKSEKEKEASEKRKENMKVRLLSAIPQSDERRKEVELARKTAEAEGVKVASVLRRRARRRAAASGHIVVPRAVSSIISVVLKAATKSHPTKKRKRKPDVGPEHQNLPSSPEKVGGDSRTLAMEDSLDAGLSEPNAILDSTGAGLDEASNGKRLKLERDDPSLQMTPSEGNNLKPSVLNGIRAVFELAPGLPPRPVTEAKNLRTLSSNAIVHSEQGRKAEKSNDIVRSAKTTPANDSVGKVSMALPKNGRDPMVEPGHVQVNAPSPKSTVPNGTAMHGATSSLD